MGLKNKNAFFERTKESLRDFVSKFIEWFLMNLFIFALFFIMKRHIRHLINPDKYELLKPILKYRYLSFNDESVSDTFALTYEEAEYYNTIIQTLPSYEKAVIAQLLNFIFEEHHFDYENDDINFDYDGFDVGRNVLYKPLIGKSKFYTVVKKGDEKYIFYLDNGKKINFIKPFNFLVYIPVSSATKRKLLIKKLK